MVAWSIRDNGSIREGVLFPAPCLRNNFCSSSIAGQVKNMRPLCVIPARGGSKRLTRKNVLPLNGRPMLQYTIEAAKQTRIFEQVYVSTECDEIASVASAAGALVHPRARELAGDLISATEVCLDVEHALSKQGSRERYDAIVCLQPSSPLRVAADVTSAWNAFVSSDCDFLVSVTAIDPHYFHWAVTQTGAGWRMYFGKEFLRERPLLPPVYRPNGAIKIGKCGPLRAERNFFGQNMNVYIMPEDRSVHVAERFDYELANFLLNNR